MKTITVPENIQTKNPVDDKAIEWLSFKRWFIETVLNDRRIGFTPAKLARVMILMGKVTAAAPGDVLDLEDADYEMCVPIVKEPELALGGPVVSAQLLPFAHAFLQAK